MPHLAATLSEIDYGDAGISQTLTAMRRAAFDATADPEVIQFAHDAVRNVRARDTDAEAKALLDATRRSFRYTHDPVNREMLKTPGVIVREMKAHGRALGDCDDYVAFLLAVLEVVGIEAQPVVISQDAGTFSHVLVRYRGRGGWVTLDPITQNSPGWFPKVQRAGAFQGGRIVEMAPGAVQGGSPAGVRFGGSSAIAPVLQRRAPTFSHAQAPIPMESSPYPAMAGLAGCCGECEANGTTCSANPNNVFARASASIKPYENLLMVGWILFSVWGATHVIRRVRS